MARSISNTVLQTVLAQANKEHNQHYQPGVFELHYTVTSEFLKDECVKQYPTSNLIVDLCKNYLTYDLVMVKNGNLPLPKLYRNLLGVGFYTNDPDENIPVKMDYDFKDPKNPTPDELKAMVVKTQARSKDFEMITIGQWNYYSDHVFKSPNRINPKTKQPFFKRAKGCIFEGEAIRVMPWQVPFAEVRYLKKTDPFKYGYDKNPDDTYVFSPAKTTEELWDETAIPYLVKGVNLLLANYLKDKDYIASAQDLRDNSIF